LLLLVLVSLARSEEGRFVKEFKVRDNITVVVAEGDKEPRSIGSYSVRVYSDLNTGSFVDGMIKSRDGYIREVEIKERDRTGSDEIRVTIATAGSGSYFAVDVFTFDGKNLRWSKEKSRPLQ
jgi:hypothetical protein